jgi:hypothetical protein
MLRGHGSGGDERLLCFDIAALGGIEGRPKVLRL